MAFCLTKKQVDTLKEKFKTGKVTPEKLADMSSAERRVYFQKFLDEGVAKQVNALFESKLILKNQQLGIINWAKQTLGMKPEVRRDILARVERLDKVLEPKELDAFLSDLVEQRLGFGVTLSEAESISTLAKKVAETKEALSTGGEKIEYGRALVEFNKFVNDLKIKSSEISLKEASQSLSLATKKILQTPEKIASNAKAIKASMDNSAIFRQGWKTLWTNPGIWSKNAIKSFKNLWDSFGGKEVMDELNADLLSRDNALNGKYKKAKVDIGTVEEAYPTSFPEKIPVLGRAYKASQDAFTAFVHKTRADIFDKYMEIAEKSGIETIDKIQLESIGKLVNSLTGRGHLGRIEPISGFVNNVFFSPRLLKSNIDFLTAHQLQKGVTPFVRKQAAINLVKVIAGTSAIMVIADALKPGSVEKDPRSADFGKIRIGNTRFDISAGMSSIITLAARLATMSSKSSVTGEVSPINSGKFGSTTGTDLIYNFFENKLSPATSVIKNLLEQQTFVGDKPTPLGELKNLFVPLPITNYEELKNNPNSANILLSIIADALGIGTNTYSKKVKEVKPKTNKSIPLIK